MDRFNDCPMTTDADGNPIVDTAKLPDPLHPWCHLIDPEWVLKYPAASCRQRGPGPTLVNPQSAARAQSCADVSTCVAEDASGNCVGGYGYCVREKSSWKLDADACPGQYASCTTYQRAGGGTFSYLSNTLDGAACNTQNAGCRQYSVSPNAVPNPSFEDVLGDAPRDWTLSAQARLHLGGRLSMHGSNAVGLSGASTASARIAGLMPGKTYRLSGSVLQEVENTAAVGKIRVTFLNNLDEPVAPGTLASTCASVASGTAVDLDIASTSLGYLSGACEITLPPDAVAAEVALSTNAAVGNRTWFDEIGFFGDSYSASPYDAVFMNGKVQKCAEDGAGCTEFARLSTGTLNVVRNPSFEALAGDVPAFWAGTQASRYDRTGPFAQEGFSAYALSTSAISQEIGGVLADASYSFTIQSRLEAAGATTGRATLQLYDASVPPQPVAPVAVEGCVLAGTAMRLDLSDGLEYFGSDCRFTTPSEVGSVVVTLTSSAAAPRLFVDSAQLELSVRPTAFHDGYAASIGRVLLKKAPEGLNCAGSNPPSECAKYAPSCRRDEVGCSAYTPVTGGSVIPAVTTDADICPSECAGYDTFRQEPSNFSDARFPLFLIPTTAGACTAADVGCSEFTNVERLSQGGEAREYFSYLRLCAAPGPQSATYYTWEGNDTRGFQLRTWSLLRSNIADAVVGVSDPTGGNAPCSKLAYGATNQPICADDAASVAEASCSKALVGADPDCREFYDDVGNIHYRLYSKTIVSTEDCKEYRMTKTTQSECESHGGLFRNGECRYRSYASESVSCLAQVAGCRAYSGNASRNIRIVFSDEFETGTTEDWLAAIGGAATTDVVNSTEAVSQGGRSLKVTRQDVHKSVAGSVTAGRQYILNFWAKGTGDLSARFSHASSIPFTFNRVTGRDEPVALTTEWRPYQIGPVEAANAPEAQEELIIERLGGGASLMYLDNIELREVTDNIFLIEDSWQTPDSCDQTPVGDPAPQYMLGCRAYRDQGKKLAHFKSFEKLCRQEAVGCEALYDTRNTTSPFAATYNAVCTLPDGADADASPDVCTGISCPCSFGGAEVCQVTTGSVSCRFDIGDSVPLANVSPTGDSVRVPADGVTYLVNDPKFRCESTNLGCMAMGDRTMTPDRTAVQSWTGRFLKNVPDDYDTT
ncbi:MAG TPA: hypothetical protein VJ694_01360, partial [Patescibacteria group bacterium]|nr:hypothetical protein [Patescibacteria group bacterium]